MTELLTAAQMRAIEKAAIESGQVTGLELMERAGRGVIDAVFAEWPDLARAPCRALVLCGPGNNGGDGFVLARLLKEWGWEIDVFLYGDPAKLPPDAKANHDRWQAMGEVAAMSAVPSNDARHDLLIDAVFGTGLTRPLPADVRNAFRHVFRSQAGIRFVGVDSASGICMDSGKPLGDRADNPFQRSLIVQFHRGKLGQFLFPEAGAASRVRIADIGLSGGIGAQGVKLVTERCAHALGKPQAHKYAHGHAFVLSGGAGHTGAARLAARGALRIGAGLVTLGVPGSAQMEVAGQVTAIMLKRTDGPEELAAVLEDGRINALCLGPGLGIERARGLVRVACGGVEPRPTVLDADALTCFSDAPEEFFAMLHEDCVLTPHAGEFARLFPDIAERLNAAAETGPAYSKVDATRDAAARAGCVVLFKGPDTVIAAPDGRCSISLAAYDRAAPWLATAGSGDVLAGFITGLLARGVDPMQAAETAAWLHVQSALSFGPGLIAEDIPEELPRVFRALGL